MANLVFKYRWNHGPYPLNSAQGKLQFMLPFASGIPNLAPAFSQITNIPNTNPASRLVGTAAGNVMEVGSFGVGGNAINVGNIAATTQAENPNLQSGLYNSDDVIGGFCAIKTSYGTMLFGGSIYNNSVPQYGYYNSTNPNGNKVLTLASLHTFKTTQNTTVDGNGFIKAASPIVKLFANKIDLNEDAAKQPLEYEKLGTGNYLLKGSSGFAEEGWYIEVPKDANGNNVVAVEYTTLENGDLLIKTYKRKFDFELAAIVADHENSIDIPDGRWIDIRLHEEPIIISNTPVNFQPTNLSQAVSAALEGIEPPEASDTDETL